MSNGTSLIDAGDVVLISGSTGIGAATARLAAKCGARVFVVSRNIEHGRDLAEEINTSGGECGCDAADLTVNDEVETAVKACIERYGHIDALFNVAGISGRKFGDGPLHECTEDGWDMTLDTNVKSMFLVCRAVLKQMMDQRPSDRGLRGTILNMASVLAYSPERTFFATHAYAASKGAILSMSKSMAAYYAPLGIRVNAIAPALVKTPMSLRAQTDEAVLQRMKVKQPLADGLIEADDVARAALFLLGKGSSMITGDVLTVDAGWCVSG